MRPIAVMERMQNILLDMKQGIDVANIKSRHFISAEGAYSSLVFGRKNLSVLITGSMLNDKSNRPVVFNVRHSM